MIAVVHSRLTTKNLGQLILLLDLLIVAGLIAGIMPQPIYRQYLAPLYPALFIRFGLTELWMPRKRVWQGLFYIFTWAAFAENACSEGGHIFPNALSGKSPPIAVSRDAQWVGRQVPRSSRVAESRPNAMSTAASSSTSAFRPDRSSSARWSWSRRTRRGAGMSSRAGG